MADIISNDVEYLNELPLNKLLSMKNSLKELVTTEYENETKTTTPSYLQRFGAQAMAIQAQPPIKRGDYEEALYKKGESKISNIFSMSVTTLAFLAFGGYLLCLIVQAVKAKQNGIVTTPTQPTFFVSAAGIKKKPQSQFASYGRKRRENRLRRSLKMLDVPPEQLFTALLQVCESFAKWSDQQEYINTW
ncbi:unnamed protein product [Arctia plantaginis]|uniref:Uncharacterized protein n=1 Tax=Arctia plantaginis TaxID=874455 RepID=A0A8S1AAG4_ARCPL|nr:unnamed protein product [Arctia plantaginis]CAB3255634.1 unnamed protein product [Arctia plantaginis]